MAGTFKPGRLLNNLLLPCRQPDFTPSLNKQVLPAESAMQLIADNFDFQTAGKGPLKMPLHFLF